MVTFYGSGIFYNSGAFYTGATTAEDENIPLDLRFYRTSQDGIYVFWWGFDPRFISPYLASVTFQLQLDTSPLFTSPNLVTYDQFTAITYQNGNVRKGFAVPVASRINGVVQTWYARVRSITLAFTSEWSSTLIWTIPLSVQQSTAEALMRSLPDFHVYGKGDLLKPVNQRNSNLWVVENMYGNQFDQVYYATYLTGTNNYVDLCVDESLYQNFGILFNFPKPLSMQYVDYRWILMNLMLASLVGGTVQAILDVVSSFTGVPPLLLNVRDENDFFLNTIQDPVIVPSGPTSIFHTSYQFIDGTLVVEDITTGLLVPSSDYTTDPVQQTWTMNSPTTDTLQATFDVGKATDPVPLVFNGLDYTLESGTMLLTNGSTLVAGTGTSFIAQLTIGDQITDALGIYIGTIQIITDNIHLTLVKPWFGPTETSGVYKLRYTDIQIPPPILWDKMTLAAGLIIDVLNPGKFALNETSIETLGNLLSPAYVKNYYIFE